MARKKKQAVLEPDAPLKCKVCEVDLTDVVMGDPPVCPYCGEPVPLKDKPVEPTPPAIEITPIQSKPESYGIRANVIIPQISDIEVNKLAINKDGKMVTKITLEVENLNEISLLRIVHMMGSRVQMHATIGADKLQTDFLDIVDPETNKKALAQVSRKDLEEKGFYNWDEDPGANGHKDAEATKGTTEVKPETLVLV
jgi:hypothetical protein